MCQRFVWDLDYYIGLSWIGLQKNFLFSNLSYWLCWIILAYPSHCERMKKSSTGGHQWQWKNYPKWTEILFLTALKKTPFCIQVAMFRVTSWRRWSSLQKPKCIWKYPVIFLPSKIREQVGSMIYFSNKLYIWIWKSTGRGLNQPMLRFFNLEGKAFF